MLTENENRVLGCIRRMHQKDLRPTVRDICRETGIGSSSVVWAAIGSLKEKGYVEAREGQSRGIKLKNPDGTVFMRVPLINGLDVITGRTQPETPEEFVPFDLPGNRADGAFAVRLDRGVSDLRENDAAVFARCAAENRRIACFSLAGRLAVGVYEVDENGACAVIGEKRIPLGGDADIAVAGRFMGFVRKSF